MTPRLAPPRPDLVWVHGPDAVRFLNDLISQEIATSSPGTVCRSLFLNARGRIDHIMWVLRDEEGAGLVVDEGRGEALAGTLGRYRIRVKAEIEQAAAGGWLVMGRRDVDPGTWRGDPAGLVADVSWGHTPRTLLVGERPELGVMGEEEYHRLRILEGEPLAGVDVDDAAIPQETGLVPATVAFDKGCFLGQELVARLDSRGGRVNRHLRILRLGEGGVNPGAEVVEGAEVVGKVSSAAGDLALALLHRRIEPGTEVGVGGAVAVVEAVPEIPRRRFTDS